MHVINKQSCRDEILMVFVRKLVLVCLEHNIFSKAKHIPGTHNILADSLSRLQVQIFKQLAPANMNPFPTDRSPALAASKLGDIYSYTSDNFQFATFIGSDLYKGLELVYSLPQCVVSDRLL